MSEKHDVPSSHKNAICFTNCDGRSSFLVEKNKRGKKRKTFSGTLGNFSLFGELMGELRQMIA
jgi:hypothetical protein